MKKITLFFLLLFISDQINSQIDSSHFLNFYYGLGVANPVGSYSKQSGDYNKLGKLGKGLNMKAGMEFFLNAKNGFSFDLDYAFFFNSKNDSIANKITERIDSYGIPYIKAGDDQIDVYIATVCLGYSRLFNFKKFSLQTKINLGCASFAYDYSSAYLLTNALSSPVSTSITANEVIYEVEDYRYFTLKPELLLKKTIKQNKNVDIMLSLGISYFYARPNIVLYETKDSKTTEVFRMKDNVNCVNVNLSLNLVLKRSLLDIFN